MTLVSAGGPANAMLRQAMPLFWLDAERVSVHTNVALSVGQMRRYMWLLLSHDMTRGRRFVPRGHRGRERDCRQSSELNVHEAP